MNKHIINFSPAEYFGSDGSDPETGPWVKWISGEDALFGPAFAEHLWWHLCVLMTHFQGLVDLQRSDGEQTAEYLEGVLNEHLSLAEFHQGCPLKLITPYSFETLMARCGGGDSLTLAKLMSAYGVWCIDRLIDALRVNDAKTASFAVSNAFCALEIAQEYRVRIPDVRALAEVEGSRCGGTFDNSRSPHV